MANYVESVPGTKKNKILIKKNENQNFINMFTLNRDERHGRQLSFHG